MKPALCAAALLLSACAATTAPGTGMGTGMGEGVTSTALERVASERGYSSPIWLSDTFAGSHSRTVDGQTVRLAVVQTASDGGLDTAVSRERPSGTRPVVDDVHPDTYVCFAYDVDLDVEGKWWAGPKISVNWLDDPYNYHGTDGWFENYIVETASQSPAEMEAEIMGDYFKGDYLGDTVHDGATYRHYKIFFQDWVQFYAVRQGYREEGSTSLAPILAKWREHGLANKTYDGTKLNIETYGPARGDVLIAGYVPADSTVAPVRAAAPGCHAWVD